MHHLRVLKLQKSAAGTINPPPIQDRVNMFDRQILTFGYGTPGTYSGGQKYFVFYFARSITPTKFC